jgi:serine/threonine-protein kinase
MQEARGPMPVARVFHIGKQIAQGLAAAHVSNVVHRDLKPDNVMLVTRGTERDFVKILDFGIAKVAGVSTMTRAGSIFGTPHYMSPEQAAGAPVDHRTDIYALGVILYEMAAGRVPFDADNMMGILTQHMYKTPAPIRALVPPVDVPASLDAIVLKCLSKKPEQRYATMDELAQDLERGERGVLPNAVPEMRARSGRFDVPAGYPATPGMPLPVPASPSGHRSGGPVLAVVAVAGVLVLAVGVAVFVRLGGRAAHALPAATPTAAAVAAPASAPEPAPPPTQATVAEPAASASAAGPALREIIVSVVPVDATISRDGVDLGTQPIALHLAQGESATVVVSRKGYKPRTVTLDGSDPKVAIALEGVFGAPAAAPAGGARKRPVDDVGDPFANKR